MGYWLAVRPMKSGHPLIVRCLVDVLICSRRDYSEEDIAKLWGENLLQVLSEVEQVAAAAP